MCGDFNQLDLTSFLADTGLCQIDTGPTRGRHALDRFITNSLWLQNQLTVAKSCLNTDHYALLVNCTAQPTINHNTRRVVTFPDIRQHNLDTLAQSVHFQDWSDITTATDVDTAYSLFIQQLSFLVQSNVPFRRITVTHNTPSYITPLIKSLLRKRNKLMHRGKSQAAGELSTKIGNLVAKHREEELKTQITKTPKSSGARSDQPWEPTAEPQL